MPVKFSTSIICSECGYRISVDWCSDEATLFERAEQSGWEKENELLLCKKCIKSLYPYQRKYLP